MDPSILYEFSYVNKNKKETIRVSYDSTRSFILDSDAGLPRVKKILCHIHQCRPADIKITNARTMKDLNQYAFRL